MTYAEKALQRLSETAGVKSEFDFLATEGEDETATNQVDPFYRGDVVIYTDGSGLGYSKLNHQWRASKMVEK